MSGTYEISFRVVEGCPGSTECSEYRSVRRLAAALDDLETIRPLRSGFDVAVEFVEGLADFGECGCESFEGGVGSVAFSHEGFEFVEESFGFAPRERWDMASDRR